MNKVLLIIGAIAILTSAPQSRAEGTDVCPELGQILEKHIAPELNTGIQKNLALAVLRKETTNISHPMTIKKDLWKKIYIIKYSDRSTQSDKLDILQTEICSYLNARIAEIKLKKGDQLLVLLNPSTETISNIMEDWSQKHVGIYKNMGLRVRWNSLTEIQKSQKSFPLKTVGGNL